MEQIKKSALVSVLDIPEISVPLTYQLLLERPSYANIHHKKNPDFEEHKNFVLNHPYTAWYVMPSYVGAIYLTKRNEIGYFVLKNNQRQGHATKACLALMSMHQGPFLLNIAPENEPSIAFARKLGAKLISHTFSIALDPYQQAWSEKSP